MQPPPPAHLPILLPQAHETEPALVDHCFLFGDDYLNQLVDATAMDPATDVHAGIDRFASAGSQRPVFAPAAAISAHHDVSTSSFAMQSAGGGVCAPTSVGVIKGIGWTRECDGVFSLGAQGECREFFLM